MKDFFKTNYQYLGGGLALLGVALFWIARVDDFYNVVRAIGMMVSGFYIMAAMNFITKSTWNGYANQSKMLVSFSIFSVLSILLVTVPESAGLLQTFGIQMDVNGEGRLGFIVLGSVIAKLVQPKVRPQNEIEDVVNVIQESTQKETL